MDDLLLKRADTILADNRAVRARIREELLQARIGMARIRATVLMARAERETSRSIRTELHAANQESMPREREPIPVRAARRKPKAIAARRIRPPRLAVLSHV